jgi:hypothetical protein
VATGRQQKHRDKNWALQQRWCGPVRGESGQCVVSRPSVTSPATRFCPRWPSGPGLRPQLRQQRPCWTISLSVREDSASEVRWGTRKRGAGPSASSLQIPTNCLGLRGDRCFLHLALSLEASLLIGELRD